VGIMHEPSAGLVVAILDLQNREADSGLRDVLVHALAAKVAGRCVFQNSKAEFSVRASFSARIVMEWRVTIPWAGVLQALFIVGGLGSVEQPSRLFDIELQLAGKPAFKPLTFEEDGSPLGQGSF
jgi:predicted secreted protein